MKASYRVGTLIVLAAVFLPTSELYLQAEANSAYTDTTADFLQATRNNAAHFWRNVAPFLAKQFRIVPHHGRKQCSLGLRRESSFAAEHLVQHRTEREHIAARIPMTAPGIVSTDALSSFIAAV